MVKSLTKQEVLDLYNSLQLVGSLVGAKFAYAVARNIVTLKPEIAGIEAAFNATDEFTKYDKERVALAELHAVKTPEGKPVVKAGQYQLVDEVKFNAELLELQAKHPGVVEARQKQLDGFQELMNEKVDIDLYVIEPGQIPHEINSGQMVGILNIVEESLKN